MQHIQHHLQHGLDLHIPARRAEGHHPAAARHHHGRVGCQPRALARRDTGGMRGIRPALASAIGRNESKPRHHRRIPGTIRRCRAESIAPTIHHRDIGCIRLNRRQITPHWPIRRAPRAQQRWIHGRMRAHRVHLGHPRGQMSVRQQGIQRHINESRVAKMIFPVRHGSFHAFGEKMQIFRRIVFQPIQPGTFHQQ